MSNKKNQCPTISSVTKLGMFCPRNQTSRFLPLSLFSSHLLLLLLLLLSCCSFAEPPPAAAARQYRSGSQSGCVRARGCGGAGARAFQCTGLTDLGPPIKKNPRANRPDVATTFGLAEQVLWPCGPGGRWNRVAIGTFKGLQAVRTAAYAAAPANGRAVASLTGVRFADTPDFFRSSFGSGLRDQKN